MVNYDRTFLRVCMDFLAYAIAQSDSLDIICRPWVPSNFKEDLELPSWLIDAKNCAFRPQPNGTFLRVNADPLVGQDAMKPKRYKACGELSRPHRLLRSAPNNGWGFGFFDRPSEFQDEKGSHRSLFVTGFELDTIGEIMDRANDGTIPNEWFEFAGWRNQSTRPPDNLWRTLMANRDSYGDYLMPYYQRTLGEVVQKHCAEGGALNVKHILATPSSDARFERLLDRILAVTSNRRLFKTTMRTNNLLGLAPAKAKIGDKVCILSGCSVPVVLRQLYQEINGKRCEYYELVGEAYVHGMMDGAAMEIHPDGPSTDVPSTQYEIR